MASEFDLGGEGDLFKAPKRILEEPFIDQSPVTASFPVNPCYEDVMSLQMLNVSEMESSFEKEQLLSDAFYGCKIDLFSNGVESSAPDVVLDAKIPITQNDGKMIEDKYLSSQGSFWKSDSFESLSSMEMMQGAPMGHDFLDFYGTGFGAAYGIRRSFSEGDIKSLGHDSVSHMHAQHGQPQLFGGSTTEGRMEKLLRYKIKRTKRNFVRKINYACRKTLADNQPRIRGRFAKQNLMHPGSI
ncbi:unnamed protein product [Cuscuta epithymum]|uniref:CCT domain-containing protein n=1 Tax=Cuscuta epithymum TaxID=186058 RepID=A0AAV0GDP3_9ASTE|nr:unnamed protein product [Cuscuta epithymum]CAH9146040.1 unnamed protein product [Cuscuta epithymum]